MITHSTTNPPTLQTGGEDALREAIAVAIQRADEIDPPDNYGSEVGHPEVSDWSVFLADKVIEVFCNFQRPERSGDVVLREALEKIAALAIEKPKPVYDDTMGWDWLTDDIEDIYWTGIAEGKFEAAEIARQALATFPVERGEDAPIIDKGRTVKRKLVVDSADYWYDHAHRNGYDDKPYSMAERLLFMENALNHTENTLIAERRERGLDTSGKPIATEAQGASDEVCKKHDWLYAKNKQSFESENWDHIHVNAFYRICFVCRTEQILEWRSTTPPQASDDADVDAATGTADDKLLGTADQWRGTLASDDTGGDRANTDKMDEAGHVTWASTEEGGGPDVGITVGLGPDAGHLWLGEITRAAWEDVGGKDFSENDMGWWLIHYHGKESDVLGRVLEPDHQPCREFLEQTLAPLLACSRRAPVVDTPKRKSSIGDVVDPGGFQAHLDALRNANDGFVITIWNAADGNEAGWRLWRRLDAKYSERDPGFAMNIPINEIASDLDSALNGKGA